MGTPYPDNYSLVYGANLPVHILNTSKKVFFATRKWKITNDVMTDGNPTQCGENEYQPCNT